MNLSQKEKQVLKRWANDYECGTGDSDPAAWFENHRNEIHQELSKAGFTEDVHTALKLMLDYYFES
jgi:hypothetical protein